MLAAASGVTSQSLCWRMLLQVLVVAVALLGSASTQRALPLPGFIYPSAPLLPIAPLFEYTRIRQPVQPLAHSRATNPYTQHRTPLTAVATQQQHTVNPCVPTPCGPNTRCEVNARNLALCKCQEGYIPDGHTIIGCKHQCVNDPQCPSDHRCERNKCVRVCGDVNACGLNALCAPRNHRAICSCPRGYHGNADISCTRRVVQADPVPQPPANPCSPNPCGHNANCRSQGNRAVCSCGHRYEGDPLVSCRLSECTVSDDCRTHQACQKRSCIDPCNIPSICGRGSECTVRNHQPVCSCPRGFVGDPFVSCRRFDPEELCRPTPCGPNTNCRVQNERAVCTCIDHYIGNPLTGCRTECVVDRDCPRNLGCQNNRCVNPCGSGACGQGALCDVRNGRAVCTCPEHFLGDAHNRCYPECTTHEECRSHQACYQLRCVDPCVGACGTGALCRVERHKPICSCPRGHTGHPFEFCRKLEPADLCRPNPCGTNADCTPGHDRQGNDRPVCTCPRGFVGNPLHSCQRGECEAPTDCPSHQTCYSYSCQSPCYTDTGSVCGVLAECTVRNRRPVCSCPRGYSGNPLARCYVDAQSRFIVGRSK